MANQEELGLFFQDFLLLFLGTQVEYWLALFGREVPTLVVHYVVNLVRVLRKSFSGHLNPKTVEGLDCVGLV